MPGQHYFRRHKCYIPAREGISADRSKRKKNPKMQGLLVNNVVNLHCVEQTLHTGTVVGCPVVVVVASLQVGTIMLFKFFIIFWRKQT